MKVEAAERYVICSWAIGSRRLKPLVCASSRLLAFLEFERQRSELGQLNRVQKLNSSTPCCDIYLGLSPNERPAVDQSQARTSVQIVIFIFLLLSCCLFPPNLDLLKILQSSSKLLSRSELKNWNTRMSPATADRLRSSWAAPSTPQHFINGSAASSSSLVSHMSVGFRLTGSPMF